MIRWVMLAIFLSTAQTQSISSQGPMDVTTVMVSSKSPYPNPVSTHHTSVGPALTATGKTAMTGSVVNTGQASTTSSSRGSTQSATDEYQDTTSTPLLVVLVITELIINEPDDKWIQSDGGQALDFTVRCRAQATRLTSRGMITGLFKRLSPVSITGIPHPP
ncbi:uncharacterized protein LOC102801128 [Saccoglossus kowalevskii]|uniref:Uncharacterized protein LOC102801128 n=1 Tax=Saccoglossus kowalevskii TaxID=10224 RepID=A0ABM0MK35_SACKO|nr:PREDICTED: uncharacterized protein LOC102801128 [Saccoglossus kowalevskii]